MKHYDKLDNNFVCLVNVEVEPATNLMVAGLAFIKPGITDPQQQLGQWWVELPTNALGLPYVGIQYKLELLIL